MRPGLSFFATNEIRYSLIRHTKPIPIGATASRLQFPCGNGSMSCSRSTETSIVFPRFTLVLRHITETPQVVNWFSDRRAFYFYAQ